MCCSVSGEPTDERGPDPTRLMGDDPQEHRIPFHYFEGGCLDRGFLGTIIDGAIGGSLVIWGI